MTYFLKTSLVCNGKCIYCGHLAKKSLKHKTVKDIERELGKVKSSGFDAIRLSCNTEIRKDFLVILKLIKRYGFRIILESRGKAFRRLDFLKKADEYVDAYEIYFHSPEFIKGVKNILKVSRGRKSAIAKAVIMNENLPFLRSIIDKIKQLGFSAVKFILPFKIHSEDGVPFLANAVSNIAFAINYASKKKLKILLDGKDLEYNPYLPEDLDFFNEKKAKLEIDFKRYGEKPKFSVIIPTFNRKKFLPFVLNNFFKQNYHKSKYEIIVVDDGSDDNTLAAIKKIKPTCNFKYFYWPRKKITPRGNLRKIAKFYNRAGPARNIGIQYSQGEVILFNDADILAPLNCLAKHEKYHRRHSNIIVRGFRMFLPADFNPRPQRIRDPSFLNNISHPERIRRWQEAFCRMYYLSDQREIWGPHRVVTANLSLRKKYLKRAGGFSWDFVFWGAEDVDLGFRLARLKMKLIWDKNIKVHHLYHQLESGNKLNILFALWLGKNILYRKYLDPVIYAIPNKIISFYLEELALSDETFICKIS
jgi:glycosyltransferase involved in cell wall biosynthesis